MKIKIFFTIFCFLSTLTLFAFLTPKPASATHGGYGCTLITKSIAAGGQITVHFGGHASGESVRLLGIKGNAELGKTQDSLSAIVPQNFTIPSTITTDTGYNIVVVFRFHDPSSDTCSGGPLNVTAAGGRGSAECDSLLNCVNIPTNPAQNFSSADGFIGKLVTSILPLVLVLGGFISIIMIVISGIQFVTSSGNPDGAAAARGRLTYALVGFVLLTLAFAITKAIDIVFLKGSGTFSIIPIPTAYAFQLDNPVLFPPAANRNVGSLATIIVQVLIAVAGVLSFIFIIIGGFKMVTSGGDPKKLDSAKSTILYAIIGVMVALLALVIVNLVQRFVGTSIKIT